MLKDTIWIIVPVYNSGKTLKKCVKSVQKQTCKNWKLVLVDDESTDSSGRLCDNFAARDDRIVVIHQTNSGPAIARRNGLKSIPDDGFCAFLDSDDELPESALELLFSKARQTGADFVCGCSQRLVKGIKLPVSSIGQIPQEKDCYSQTEILNELYIGCFGMNVFSVALWAKLFKTDKLKKVMLEDVQTPYKFAEDLDVILRLLPTLEKVAFIPESVYLYRTGGGTSKFMPAFLEDNLFMYNRKKEYMRYYTGEQDAYRLVAIELKNIIMTYFSMCFRFNKFPNGGNIEKEIEFVLSLPEAKDALPFIKGDNSGFAGSAEAMLSGDTVKIASVIATSDTSSGLKAFLKLVLSRL